MTMECLSSNMFRSEADGGSRGGPNQEKKKVKRDAKVSLFQTGEGGKAISTQGGRSERKKKTKTKPKRPQKKKKLRCRR